MINILHLYKGGGVQIKTFNKTNKIIIPIVILFYILCLFFFSHVHT